MTVMNASHIQGNPHDNHTALRASVTIVDADIDSAEALQALIEGFPGVKYVHTVTSPAAAIELLAGGPDVVAFDGGSPVRQIVLVDARQEESAARATLELLRSELPQATIVLLCVYPDQSRRTVCTLADRCMPKDTTLEDVRALLCDLLEQAAS